jgi:hypothetical protein
MQQTSDKQDDQLKRRHGCQKGRNIRTLEGENNLVAGDRLM